MDPRGDNELRQKFYSLGDPAVLTGLKPFSITITDPQEAAHLFGMCIRFAASNHQDQVVARKKIALLIASHIRESGFDKGIDLFLADMKELELPFPKWFKPLFLYMNDTTEEAFKKFKEEHKG